MRRVLPPLFAILLLAAAGYGLHGALRHVALGDVLAALAATPGPKIGHAFLVLAAALVWMACYDGPGVLFAHRLVRFPKVKPWDVALASFCAYALSHVMPAPALTAAAIRLRLYVQWGVPAAGVARIVAMSGSMFSSGLATLLGILLLFHPGGIPVISTSFSSFPSFWPLRLLGAALLAAIAAYVLAARAGAQLRLCGRAVTLPGHKVAALQIFLSCLDIATACAILYAVLPDAPGLDYPHVLVIYLAAFAAGMFSGLPGGVGVLDSLLLLGLSDYVPAAAALGAILLFRVLYFLLPAAAAALCYAGHEIWVAAARK